MTRAFPLSIALTSLVRAAAVIVVFGVVSLGVGHECQAQFMPEDRAPPPKKKAPSWNLGAKAGILFSGEVYVAESDRDVGTEQGFMLELTADLGVGPYFMVGLFGLLATTEDEDSDDVTVKTFGTTFKGRFGDPGNFEIRPGLGLGYNMIEVSNTDDIDGMDVAAILEFVYYTSPTLALLGEVSFVSQPVGGNEDTDVTFAPILFVAGGAAFAGL